MVNTTLNATSAVRYGPRVLGQERYEAQQRIVENAADRYGPRVTGHLTKAPVAPEVEPAPVVPPTEPPTTEPAQLSLRKLELALEANPALLDELFEAEQARPDPRKGAYRLMLEVEAAQAKPRHETLERIRAALAALD